MPVARVRGNVSRAPLRWSIERAAGEFKLVANTLRKLLNQSGAEPDQTGCYSTQQLIAAVYGDLHAERLQKERELVRKYRLENQITESQYLNRAEIARGLAMIADAMTSIIMSSELSRPAKENLLRELSSIPLVLEETAHAQSRLRRGNGTLPEAD